MYTNIFQAFGCILLSLVRWRATVLTQWLTMLHSLTKLPSFFFSFSWFSFEFTPIKPALSSLMKACHHSYESMARLAESDSISDINCMGTPARKRNTPVSRATEWNHWFPTIHHAFFYRHTPRPYQPIFQLLYYPTKYLP